MIESTPYTRIVGLKLNSKEHGRNYFLVTGTVKLVYMQGRIAEGGTELESGEFNNRLERQELMKMWSRKYMIHLIPKNYQWIVTLNEHELN